ncbi:hypothetical protein NQ318_006517 [Aromia moschata]|uniref:Senescence domain-containing protein n=1 Tax=Aromia moschata TaxID=1265417 RepID=A0AAV8YPM3_9CUCU|nr:hypothetical protein NQ318_006517 [Aromia moschata]
MGLSAGTGSVPCYRTDYGAFILPNVHSDVPGSSVGIILPPDADGEVFDLLENILHGIISQATEEEIQERRRRKEPTDLSTQVSSKIVDGAWYISQGLIKGAEKAGEFFNSSTPKIISNMKSSETPAHIPPKLSKGVQVAESATSTAARVTGFVADKVGTATIRLGQFLAPHIQKQGTRLLTTGFNMSEQEASDKMKGILTVAAGAVEGFSTVYHGLRTSSSILATSLRDNTVKIVEHKYGQPASTLTGHTLSTVGNVYTISSNVKVITPKGLVKTTVKNTGKTVVYDYTSSSRARKSYENTVVGTESSVPESPSCSSLTGKGSDENSDKK